MAKEQYNPMEQSPSQEADNRSAGQDILCLLWNSGVIMLNLPLMRILSQLNPASRHHTSFL
jgi:hypothetical protein